MRPHSGTCGWVRRRRCRSSCSSCLCSLLSLSSASSEGWSHYEARGLGANAGAISDGRRVRRFIAEAVVWPGGSTVRRAELGSDSRSSTTPLDGCDVTEADFGSLLHDLGSQGGGMGQLSPGASCGAVRTVLREQHLCGWICDGDPGTAGRNGWLWVRQVSLPGPQPVVPGSIDDDDDPVSGHHAAALHDDAMAWVVGLVSGAYCAGGPDRLRSVRDAAVYFHHPGRVRRRSEGGRGRRMASLLERDSAAEQEWPRGAGHSDLPGKLG